MADEADFAANAEEFHRDKSLAEMRETALAIRGPARRDDGCCAWCVDADALPGGPFCSAECRDDHAEHARQRDRGFVR